MGHYLWDHRVCLQIFNRFVQGWWWRRPSNGPFDVGQVCKSQFTLQYPSSNHGVLETPAFLDDFPSFFYPRFKRFFFPSEKRRGWEVLCPMDRFPWRSGFASFGCMVSGTAIGGTTIFIEKVQHFHFRILKFPLNDGYQRLVTSFQFRWSNFFKCIERSCSAPSLISLRDCGRTIFQLSSDLINACMLSTDTCPWNPFVSSHHCRPWIFSEPYRR